jgi:hypothetical protein
MPTFNESELRSLIRRQLARGALPLQAEHQKVYGGYGADQECDGCGRRISISDVLYEVEAGSSLLALHRQCFDTWLIESRLYSAQGDAIGSIVISDRRTVIRR